MDETHEDLDALAQYNVVMLQRLSEALAARNAATTLEDKAQTADQLALV